METLFVIVGALVLFLITVFILGCSVIGIIGGYHYWKHHAIFTNASFLWECELKK